MALVEFKANYYDMIMLDYRMEGLNGLELYQKIRAIDKSARAMLLTVAHEQLELDENYKWFLRVVGKPISWNCLTEGGCNRIETNELFALYINPLKLLFVIVN